MSSNHLTLVIISLSVLSSTLVRTQLQNGQQSPSSSQPRPAAKSSQEILNDIVRYGLDRTRYLVDVLERKIYDRGVALQKSDPAHFVAVFNKQKDKAKQLAKYGYATLEASTLLTRQ